MTATLTIPAVVPVFPLSIYQPVHVGIDEFGEQAHVELAERNLLIGGEPGGGKSSAINLITAHGALSHDCRLVLIDGKQVELGLWRECADRFVGPSMDDALATMKWLQSLMNSRYDTAGRLRAAQDHPRRRRAGLPRHHRRVRLLLRHRRRKKPTGTSSPPWPAT